MEPDPRQPFRLVIDVLATAEQAQRLQGILGAAVCGAPTDHVGPCRIAWTEAYVGGDEFEGSYGLDAAEAAFTREQLEPIPVLPTADVDQSLR